MLVQLVQVYFWFRTSKIFTREENSFEDSEIFGSRLKIFPCKVAQVKLITASSGSFYPSKEKKTKLREGIDWICRLIKYLWRLSELGFWCLCLWSKVNKLFVTWASNWGGRKLWKSINLSDVSILFLLRVFVDCFFLKRSLPMEGWGLSIGIGIDYFLHQ